MSVSHLLFSLTLVSQTNADQRTLSNLKLLRISLLIIYNTTQIKRLKVSKGQQNKKKSSQNAFSEIIVPDNFPRHFRKLSLPQWNLFLVQLLISNMKLSMLFRVIQWKLSGIFRTQNQVFRGPPRKELFCKMLWCNITIPHVWSKALKNTLWKHSFLIKLQAC